jgi:hypothetical protein
MAAVGAVLVGIAIFNMTILILYKPHFKIPEIQFCMPQRPPGNFAG